MLTSRTYARECARIYFEALDSAYNEVFDMTEEAKPAPWALNLKPVKSSNIHACDHDPSTNTLYVQFKKDDGPGKIYKYAGVTAEQHTAFTGAESIGKHFAANIRSLGGVLHE